MAVRKSLDLRRLFEPQRALIKGEGPAIYSPAKLRLRMNKVLWVRWVPNPKGRGKCEVKSEKFVETSHRSSADAWHNKKKKNHPVS